MIATKKAIAAFLGLSLIAAVSLSALEEAQLSGARASPPRVVRQFVGGGNWQSSRAGFEQRGWHVQLKHFDDNSLSGRITIVGSPRLQQARIEAQISGSEVYGVLVDDSDQQVGTFTGSIFTDGIAGTHTTADGDTGNWTWNGPPPG
jgi:hypothetical protein